MEKGNKIEIGNPKVSGATVTAKVLKQGKGDKVIVFKFKAKTRRRTKKGHRQAYTEVEITEILNSKSQILNKKEIEIYINETKKKTEIERTAEGKEKTGVELKGIFAVNPATNEEVPIWIADYVLADYGTGAVMAVPAHDERDFVFAKKHDLPVKQVILQKSIDKEKLEKLFKLHKELQEEADKL